jgi:spermidine synthase
MNDVRETSRWRGVALVLAVGICFFLSGAASLVLEVVWSRLLRLVFGTTTLAISTILVAYMTGLGIGGLLGGRIARRVANGVRAYGWIEIAVGLYALAVPFVFSYFPALSRAFLSELDFWPGALARFALAFTVLCLPTIGMGLTLPFLTRALVRDERAGSGIAVLYGINTLGAVSGVFLATFVMLPQFGVALSNQLAAGAYLALGVLALLLSRFVGGRPTETAPEVAATSDRLARWNPALLAYGTVGFTSLVYEVTWTRALSMVMGSSIYAFACMLAAFLLGIGAGSLIARTFVDRLRRPLLVYAIGIAALGLLSLGSLSLLPHLPELFMALVRRYGDSPGLLVASQFGVAACAMLPPALVLGALFPLLSRAQAAASGASPAVGDVYFVNTVGSALGAFSAGFILLPLLGLRGTAAIAIALNALACAALLLWWARGRGPVRLALAALPAAFGILMLVFPPPLDTRSLAMGGFVPVRIFSDAPDVSALEGGHAEEVLYYRDGLSATVSVHRYRGDVSLHINGKADASSRQDMPTQVLLAQVPLLFGKPAKKVLVIGWASGVSVGSVARHPVEQIDAVELEPAMIEASHYFDDVNGKPLEDPRVRVIVEDARTFLANTREKYDVIVSEPSNPWLSGVSNLFTREHFRAAREALAPGGRLLQWFPLYATDPEALRSILSALRSEFPYVYAFELDRTLPDLMLMATTEPLAVADLPRFESLPPAVQSDLYRVGTRSTAELWSLLRLLPPDVDEIIAKPGVINTDDNLFVELRTPWLLYADDFAEPGTGPTERTWALIDAYGLGGWPLLEEALGMPGAPRPGELALAYIGVRHDRAVGESLAELAGDSGEGIAARQELARTANTTDAETYLGALTRAVELEPESFPVRIIRARAELMQQDLEGALAEADAALVLRPGDPSALALRGAILLRLGRPEDALAALEPVRATEYWNFQPTYWLVASRAELAVGNTDAGLALLERYVAVEPGLLLAWELLEQGYTGQGRQAEAESARHNQAINLYMRAIAAANSGDEARARVDLQRALEILPQHEPSRAALARLGG